MSVHHSGAAIDGGSSGDGTFTVGEWRISSLAASQTNVLFSAADAAVITGTVDIGESTVSKAVATPIDFNAGDTIYPNFTTPAGGTSTACDPTVCLKHLEVLPIARGRGSKPGRKADSVRVVTRRRATTSLLLQPRPEN
jgi:hypothetical protein